MLLTCLLVGSLVGSSVALGRTLDPEPRLVAHAKLVVNHEAPPIINTALKVEFRETGMALAEATYVLSGAATAVYGCRTSHHRALESPRLTVGATFSTARVFAVEDGRVRATLVVAEADVVEPPQGFDENGVPIQLPQCPAGATNARLAITYRDWVLQDETTGLADNLRTQRYPR
jgi:hypothetical protein